MLSELREVGKLLAKKEEQTENNSEHPENFKKGKVIVINLIGFDENNHKEKKLERSFKITYEEINENNIEKIPVHSREDSITPQGPLKYPAAPYTKKAVKNRIISWFGKYRENEYIDDNIRNRINDVYKFLIDKKEDIQQAVNNLYDDIVKSLYDEGAKKDNKESFYIGIKIDGKFAGEVDWIKKTVSEAEEKEKNSGKGRGICRFCGKEGNIILDYKKLSKSLKFYTLDNPSFASYFDNEDSSANLNVCEECFNLINKGISYLNDKKLLIDSIGKGENISFIIIPGISKDNSKNKDDAFKKFENSLSRNYSNDLSEKDYFIDSRSPDTAFENNTYIFFQDNQQNRKIIEEIFDVKAKRIHDFIEKDKKIKGYFSSPKYDISYKAAGGIIKFILGTLYPNKSEGNKAYKNEVDYEKREVIMLAIKMIKYALTDNTQSIAFKDLVKKFYRLAEEILKVSLLNENVSTSSAKKTGSEKNGKNTAYPQILAKKVLYTLFLFNIISMDETSSQNKREGKIMKLIEMLPEEKRMWVLIGLYLGGLANFQEEKLGIRSPFIEKTLFIPNKETILNLFGEAKAKLIQYRDYEAFTEYSGRFDKIENQIAQYVLKYKYSKDDISNEEARLLFRIGLCLKNYWSINNGDEYGEDE
ncbi:MAG: TM1802 family CRISPR-associated protein [Thermoproteota archaeon]|nr:TM1802 family CRISPR-associated protein [Candidatus Rehaiarchaeum fermentans]MCW1292510.1 TM1802 family CRISPR-associated protein [Candidatus Rehaiarchaeum fermentans]